MLSTQTPAFGPLTATHQLGRNGGGTHGSHTREIGGVLHYFQYETAPGGAWSVLVRALIHGPDESGPYWHTIRQAASNR
ncbi:hypothetical protein ABTX60_06960 [Streptomyces sp. NPDC126510]|uniref:hypothetical protein n=1 Tax=Streptomyces sp. NPDC126510 TaxID=3155317 RepID=UPI00331B1CF4